ncbi:MAG: sugar transferase [Candidatus Omnitrophica bacterium]|nr:sugar transferase [Candidatus Omnitrophota bacterium]
MIESFRKSYPVYITIDIFLIILSFVSAYLLKYTYFYPQLSIDNSYLNIYLFLFTLWGVFILISFGINNLHSTDRGLTIPKELLKVLQSISCASILIGAVIFFAKYKFFSRQVFLTSFLYLFLFLAGFRVLKRIILRRLIVKGFHNINVLIVGADKLGRLILDEIRKSPFWGLNPVGFLDDHSTQTIEGVRIIGKIKDFQTVIKKYFVDEVIIAKPMYDRSTLELINQARKFNLGSKIIPADLEEVPATITTSYLGAMPLLTYKERMHHPTEVFIKRFLDIISSLALITIFFPVFIILPIMIKLDSKGPVLFIRPRIGMKGKIFYFYKFRSMVKDAEKLREELLDENEVRDGVIFKIKKDPRITKAGKFMRRFSLDELPQLFNVLKGDMSLVGPRPPLPDEVKEYSYNHMQRLAIRPGMTGLSQVRGRSELTFRKWVRWDLWYINNWSFGLDLRILFWTIPVVIKGKGAY